MKKNTRKNRGLALLVVTIISLTSVFSGCTKAGNSSGEVGEQKDKEIKTSLTGKEFMYTKKNGLYEYKSEKDKEVRLSKDRFKRKSDYDRDDLVEAQYSPDGNYVYYLEPEDYNYSRALKMLRRENDVKDKAENKEKEEQTLASDVSEFKVLKNGKVLYKTDYRDGLYIWDNEDSENIAKGVEFYDLAEDESFILYLTDVHYSYGSAEEKEVGKEYDSTKIGTLNLYSFAEEEAYKIAKNVVLDRLVYNEDFSSIYYVSEEGEKYNLYYIKDMAKSETKEKEPHLVAEIGKGIIFINKKTGGVYYSAENNENALYDMLIEDDVPDEAQGVNTPEISEEDKKLMAEKKEVIKDKGLKEYALQQMKTDFKTELKKAVNDEHFGSLSYYNKTDSKELSTSALISPNNLISDNETVSFTQIDKDKVEKVKLSKLFDDYLYKLNAVIDYSDEEDADEKDKDAEKELNLDKLLYEYYKDPDSPLGMYFSAEDEELKDDSTESTEEETRRGDGRVENLSYYGKKTQVSDLGYNNAIKKEEDFTTDDEYNYYSDYFSDYFSGAIADSDRDSYWEYEGTPAYVAYDFIPDILLTQSRAFEVAAVSEDKVYSLEADSYTIGDVYVNEEDNSIYIVKANKEIQDNIKSASEDNYRYFSSESYGREDGTYPSKKYELYKAALNDKEVGSFELLDDEVKGILGVYKDKLYYIKTDESEYSYSSMSLYCDKKKIKSDCIAVGVVNGNMYLETEGSHYSALNLYKLDGENAEKVGSEIYEYKILDDGSIVYIDNYDEDKEKGNLKLWKGKDNKETLGKDAMNIIGGNRGAYYSDVYAEDKVYIKFR